MRVRGAVIFDRDGVLNQDVGYAYRPDQIVWSPGALEAVAAVKRRGLLAFVATNQSGVARGLYRSSDVEALHAWMQAAFKAAGGGIDAFAYCPHHPEGAVEAYRRDCRRRKPGPGMLQDLLEAFGVEPRRAVMIGDQPSDRAAASAAGIGFRPYAGGSLLDVVLPILTELAGDELAQSPHPA